MFEFSNKDIGVTSISELLDGLRIVHSDVNIGSCLVRSQLDCAGSKPIILSLSLSLHN